MIMSMYKVICVTNRRLAGAEFLSQLEKIVQTEVAAVVLREKDMEEAEYEQLAKEADRLCRAAGVPLVIHSHTAVAERLKLPNLHLPCAGLSVMTEEEKRRFKTIGASVHSVEEATEAYRAGASCLIAGHIYETECKKGKAPRGIRYLEEICQAVPIPVYAIGGITPANAGECKRAGAAGVCVMSSLMQSEEPEQLVEALLECASE